MPDDSSTSTEVMAPQVESVSERRVFLTPELVKAITAAVSSGMYIRRACALVGIGESTYYEWLQRGTAEPESIYADLAVAIEKAEASDHARRLARIEAAGEGGAVLSKETTTKTRKDGSQVVTESEKTSAPAWQADAWSLERRYRKEYSQPRGNDGQANVSVQLLFAKIELVGTDGEEFDSMDVAEIGPESGK